MKDVLTDLDLQTGCASEAGSFRKLNEDWIDCILPEDEKQRRTKGALFLVADGMGGHNAGEVASHQAVEWVAREYYANPAQDNGTSLVHAFETANRMLHDQAQSDRSQAGMGTTLVAVVVCGTPPHATIANVGDSRAYLLHRRRLQQITDDHSWVEEQVRSGMLSPSQAEQHPQRHVITRALGTRPTVQVDLFEVDLEPGDLVLLCTDGLSGEIPARQVTGLLRSAPPSQAASQLVAEAQARGGKDNASAVVVQIGSEPVAALRRHSGLLNGEWLREWAEQKNKLRVLLLVSLVALIVLCAVAGTAVLVSRDLAGEPAGAPLLGPIPTGGEGDGLPADRPDAGFWPEPRGVFLVGVVRGWQCDRALCMFGLTMAGKTYQIRCDRQDPANGHLVLEGRRVRVFGYQDKEGSVIDARLIDEGAPWWALWRPGWVAVYQSGIFDETVWVYTIVDENPYSAVAQQDLPHLSRGTQIVARGKWLKADPGESMAFVAEKVYSLKDGGYILQVREGD